MTGPWSTYQDSFIFYTKPRLLTRILFY